LVCPNLWAAERVYAILANNFPGKVTIIQWAGLLNTDTGAPFIAPYPLEKTIQVKGTFGAGGNCRIEGTNDVTTPTWAALNDAFGTALNITAAKVATVLEGTYQIRPNITAGDGTTSLTVTLILIRQ
jgi:hypothetical protein